MAVVFVLIALAFLAEFFGPRVVGKIEAMLPPPPPAPPRSEEDIRREMKYWDYIEERKNADRGFCYLKHPHPLAND